MRLNQKLLYMKQQLFGILMILKGQLNLKYLLLLNIYHSSLWPIYRVELTTEITKNSLILAKENNQKVLNEHKFNL